MKKTQSEIQPVVFISQPQYRLSAPERLARWEEAMRTGVGLRFTKAAGGVETDTPGD
jgi:hypothetical protein